jgi:hypothetical protein
MACQSEIAGTLQTLFLERANMILINLFLINVMRHIVLYLHDQAALA